MIPLRAFLVALLVMAGRAHADDGYTCADVRAAVATVARGAGVSRARAAEIIAATARGAGATEDQIARARRCMK